MAKSGCNAVDLLFSRLLWKRWVHCEVKPTGSVLCLTIPF